MREDRIAKIEEYIRGKKVVSLDELCDKFGVSKNTIRRDINEITNNSDIKKIYGGVSVQHNRIPPPFTERSSINEDIKAEIGRAAARFVEDGDIIYVDSGTTTCHLIDYLSDRKNVTIITNSLGVINRAVNYPELRVISLSGVLSRKTLSFAGTSTIDVLQSCNINKAFMAANGLTVENGATQSTSIEFSIKRTVVSRSNFVILMLENRKFGALSFLSYCKLDDIDAIVTEALPDEHFIEAYREIGGKFILPTEG